jgi:hypothetical protein
MGEFFFATNHGEQVVTSLDGVSLKHLTQRVTSERDGANTSYLALLMAFLAVSKRMSETEAQASSNTYTNERRVTELNPSRSKRACL